MQLEKWNVYEFFVSAEERKKKQMNFLFTGVIFTFA